MRRAVLVVALAACGRLGFGAHEQPDAPVVTDQPPAVTCPTGALLCDDFETGDVAKWTRSVIGGSGTATVTTAVAHRGSHALQLAYPSSGVSGAAAVALEHPVSSGTLAVREWVMSAQPLDKFNLVFTEANLVTGQFVTAGGNNSALWVSSDQDGSGVLADHNSSVATAITDWTCVETTLDLTAAPRVQLAVDGTVVLDVMIHDTAPAYTESQVGLARADQAGYLLYVDDVVIATSPIGCD